MSENVSSETVSPENVLPEDWAVPEITELNQAWFSSETVTVQACAACETLQHPPEEICHRCGSMELGSRTLSPTGTVHSYTVVHYAVNRALADSVPYAVVLVSLDDAPELRVIGNMPGVPISDLEIGMPVEAIWEPRTVDDTTTVHLPQWQPR